MLLLCCQDRLKVYTQYATNSLVRQLKRGKQQGFLKVGTKQYSKGLLRMGIKKAHLSGQIREVQRVGQSKNRIVESGKHLGSLALAYLTAILP